MALFLSSGRKDAKKEATWATNIYHLQLHFHTAIGKSWGGRGGGGGGVSFRMRPWKWRVTSEKIRKLLLASSTALSPAFIASSMNSKIARGGLGTRLRV